MPVNLSKIIVTLSKDLLQRFLAYGLTLPGGFKGHGYRILRFDRVGEGSSLDGSDGRRISAGKLRGVLEVLRRECEVLEVAELVRGLVAGREQQPGSERLMVALTFDGGFEEHYRLVLPLLSEFEVKGAFFLPTEFIGTNDLFWFQKVELALRALEADGGRITLLTAEPEFSKIWSGARNPDIRVELLLEYLKLCEVYRKQMVINELFELASALPCPDYERQFMSWKEVKLLAEQGHTIGTLGARGLNFENLTLEEGAQEVRAGVNTLKERGIRFTPLLSTGGTSLNPLQRKGFRASGLEIALAGEVSPVRRDDETWIIPRVTLNESNSRSVGLALKRLL